MVIQNPDDFQVVPQSYLKVVGVIGRGHLHAAGAELHLGIIIGHHRDFLVHQRQNHSFAYDALISLVVGIDADAGVAQHGLRAGGCHNDLARTICQGVTDVPEMTGLILVLHLRIRQSRHTVGTPVDDPATLVNEALLIQRDKHFPHSFGAALVHREPGAGPIAGGPQLLLLLHNPVAILPFPVPDSL